MDQIEAHVEKLASEREKEALEMFELSIVKGAKENFKKDRNLSPMIFLGIEQGNELTLGIMPVGQFMKSVEDKDMLSEMLKQISGDVICICMVTEAWMTEATPENFKEMMKVAPSEHPDKKEVVICTFESENICRSHMFDIIRDGEVTLGEDKGLGGTLGEGRFSGILKDLKKKKYN